MTSADPDSWQFPKWDPDWDGEFQFESLRAFANSITAATDLGVRLDIIEEGYARLEVLDGATRIGVVYVNRSYGPSSQPQFAIFAGADGEELQTTDVSAGLRFLSARRSLFPDDA